MSLIISRTPFRMSFFGGGTDYPEWYMENGGAVLSTTIDKYCYISCRYMQPFLNIKHRVVWRHVESVITVADILHPAVREGLRYLGFDDSNGLEIHYQGDLPARAGMGSSSAFAVGLIRALTALRGQMISKHDLALKAIELERDKMGDNVGSQDQVAVAYGGLNVIQFKKNGEILVEPVTITPSKLLELQSKLLLFYTGTGRSASKVAADVVANMGKNENILSEMYSNVTKAVSILSGESNIDEFGNLLHANWMLKRRQSKMVSNLTIDHIYETALKHGAIGGKLLGAGSSGFMVFYVPEEKQADVISSLSDYLHVPFKFDTEGSTLIHYGINGSQ